MKTETLGKLQTSFSGNHSFHRDYGPTEIKSISSRNRDTIYGKRLKSMFFLTLDDEGRNLAK